MFSTATNTYVAINSTVNHYTETTIDSEKIWGLHVHREYITTPPLVLDLSPPSGTGEYIPSYKFLALRVICNSDLGCNGGENVFSYGDYTLSVGKKELSSVEEINYTDAGQLTSTTGYEYNSHHLLSKTTFTDSKGDIYTTNLKYPSDFISDPVIGNISTKMVNANMVGYQIEQITEKNSTQLNSKMTIYKDWSSTSLPQIAPQSIQTQQGTNPYESRISFYSYDSKNNPVSFSKANDIEMSYIWGYNYTYPVAQVSNASYSDIAYSSFESDSRGNWSYTGTPSGAGGSITGKRSYFLTNGNISKSGLNTSTKYILSYWSKGTVSVSGGTQSDFITGKTINGWTNHTLIFTATTEITITGNTYIDELRLYPQNAQMITFTYLPLVGMTSKCDENNRVSYYEYNDEGKLVVIRDQDKNVVKKICYNYLGQAGNCTINYNDAQSGNYTKSCDVNYTGSTVTYTVPAETYSSMVSKSDANNKAIADRDVNGPIYANDVGICTYNPQVTIQGYNTKSVRYQVKFTNTVTNSWYTFYLNSGTYSPVYLGQVPPGNYNVLFYPASGTTVYATFDINGYTQYGTGGNFSNISISSTSTARMY